MPGATEVEKNGGGTRTWIPGGFDEDKIDFDNIHDSRTDGVPTIEVSNGSRDIKIRYP